MGFVSFLILSAIRIFVLQTDIQTSLETVPEVMPSFGAGLLVTMLVVTIIYAMASAIHGGRYCVLYELDGNMLIHRQLPVRIRKDAVIDALRVLDTPSPITPEQAELQEKAFDDSIVTSLSSVSRIRGSRSHDLIVIRDSMGKNRVHVHSGDYAPIMDYLRRRCPKAKVSHQA